MKLVSPLTILSTASILSLHSVQAREEQQQSSVYLLPSDSTASTSTISNPQLASVLAHHLQVAEHRLGHFIGKDSKLWSWLPVDSKKASNSDRVSQLFDNQSDEAEAENHLNLVFHVKGADKIHGLPSSLIQTHQVSNPAPPQAIDALLRTFSSSLDSISQGPLSVFNKGLDWFKSNVVEEIKMGKANVDQWDFADESFSFLHSELSHLSDFFTAQASSTSKSKELDTFTISGLLPIISKSGSSSNEFSEGLDSLSKILSNGLKSLEANGKKLKVALILSPPEKEESISKRSGNEMENDEELMKRYFLQKRQFSSTQSGNLNPVGVGNLKKEEPKSDRDLIRSCFKSKSELEEASADCSGNGKARESRIGGEMCWKCKCENSWAGESCSRKDISAQFLLLGGSGLVLVLVALGSLYVLAAEGSKELPGVLAGIQVPTLTRN